ncbi:MAG: alpha-amylase, partial [Gemmatimonadaceae bacterium]
AAYLRRDGERVVLVVANLGATPLSDVAISSAERVLPAGRYTPRSLLGAPPASRLLIGSHGRIRGYVPVRSLGGRELYAFELTSGR